MDNFISLKIKDFEFKLKTKPGIFAKGGLDEGSKFLIGHMQINDGTVICDLGCGSGIIGFVAAKLNPNGHVHLLDDSLRATNLAQENADINGLQNVEVYLSDLFSAVGERSYHQIFSNPSQDKGNEFLEEMTDECSRHLKPKGQTIWVVQKQIKSVIERLFKKYFGNCTIVATGRIHTVIKGVKHGQR